MKSIIAWLALLTVPGISAAEPVSPPPGADEPLPPAPKRARNGPASNEPVGPKSPGAAFALSLAATGGSAALAIAVNDNSVLTWVALAGLGFGPSAGDVYAGDPSRALIHTGVRAGGVAMIVIGLEIAECPFLDLSLDSEPCRENAGSEALFIGGGVIFAVSSLYSLLSVHRSAREYNKRARRGFTLAPVPIGSPGGPTGFGLTLTHPL